MKRFEKSLRICVTKYAKKTKVVSDILDYIIQTVHHNMKYFKQFFQKNSIHAKIRKRNRNLLYLHCSESFLKKPYQGLAMQ